MAAQLTTEILDERLNDFGLKLFKYLDKRFDKTDKQFDDQKAAHNRLINTLDAFLKRLDDIEIDNTARDAQLARIERWIDQIARKTGVKLEY